MPDKPIYRIKGLSDIRPISLSMISSKQVVFPVEKKEAPSHEVSSNDVDFRQAVKALGKVTLSDYLHKGYMPGLKKLWPTCDFLGPSHSSQPIKTLPLAVGEFMYGDEFPYRHVYRTWSRHKEERDFITELVRIAETGEEISNIFNELPPIASAVAGYLFRGCPGFRAIKDQLLERICAQPASAFLGLLSGVWPASATERLIEGIVSDTRLSWEVILNASLGHAGACIDLDDTILSAAHLGCLSPYLHIMDGEERAWKRLVEVAKTDPMAAAFALGLKPQATEWNDTVKGSPEAMYWAVRVASIKGYARELPFWTEFREAVMIDPRWGYHWIRDHESGAAYEFIDMHWPDPWTIQLAGDLHLSPTAMIRQYQRTKDKESFTKHPLADAATLWTLEYAKYKEDDDDEEDGRPLPDQS